MKILNVILVLCVVALAACGASANDIVFGTSARTVAMGGAGLALTDNPSSQALVNPAAPAAAGASFHFIFPSLDVYSRGTSFNDVSNRSNELSSGNADDALKLAEDFGKQPTTLTMGFATGFTGTTGVTLQGQAQGLINPGTTFSQWVGAGVPTTVAGLQTAVTNGQITDPTLVAAINSLSGGVLGRGVGTSIADVANLLTTGTNVSGSLAYSLPAVTYGRGFDVGAGRLFVGTQMKLMHGETHVWTMQQDPSVTNEVSLQAVEDLNQRHKSNGFGADLGFIYQPRNPKVQYAMLMDNAVEPKLSGIDMPFVFSVGAGWKPARRVTLAADIYNINQAYKEGTLLRLGAEYKLGGILAVRGRYSGNCLTYGFSVIGFDVAFTTKQTGLLSHSLTF